MLVDIFVNVLSVVRLSALLPRNLERGKGEEFAGGSERHPASERRDVVGAVGPCLQMALNEAGGLLRTSQRVVRSDAEDVVRPYFASGLVVTIEHIVGTATEAGPTSFHAQRGDSIVCRGRWDGHQNIVYSGHRLHPGDDPSQHRFSGEVCEHFAGESSTSHPCLDNRNYSHRHPRCVWRTMDVFVID
jgi:hypothetical protein